MNALPPYGNLAAGFLLDGQFEIQEQIGAGSASFVYKAFDQRTKSQVAVKLLNPFLQRDRVTVERFRRELIIGRAINHPQVVKIFDFREQEALCYLVMEYVEGKNLKQVLQQEGTLPLELFQRIAKQAVDILTCCHEANVIHRDLKPQNLMIRSADQLRILDFGISKLTTMSDLTKTGTSLGTPQYMAPEHFIKGRPDARCDIYSLGIVFFELLTGRPPYSEALFICPAQTVPPSARALNPIVPIWLDRILAKMLQFDPNRRYSGMAEVAFDLEEGEASAKTLQLDQPAGQCFFCHHDLMAGLPFCGHCGTSFLEAAARGKTSLVLYQTTHPEGIAAHLVRLLPRLNPATLLKKLKKPPCVLVHRINKKTAALLFNDLNLYPATLEQVDSLPRRLMLPGVVPFASLSITAILVAFPWIPLFDGTPLALLRTALSGTLAASPGFPSIAIIAAVYGGLLLYFRRLTAPLIPRRMIRITEDTLPWSPEQSFSYQQRIKAIEDSDLKEMVATLMARSLQILQILPKNNRAPHVQSFHLLLESAFESVQQMEKMELFLSGTTLGMLEEKIALLDAKAAIEKEAEKLALLIEQKVHLVQAQEQYCATQDQYAAAMRNLLGWVTRTNLLAVRVVLGRKVDIHEGVRQIFG